MGTRGIVWTSAVLAALLRFPGALWPLRADEAGFTLVARNWDPQPDSLYGTYWVDRPPPLIALIRAADEFGGPYFLRLLAAVGCAVLVVAAAQVARLVAGDRAAAWTAVATAAVTSNTLLDSVAAKGELLGIPLIMVSIWFSLVALRRNSVLFAFAAGLLAALALGMKQNMAAGLVFGAVLLLTSWLSGETSRRDFVRLAAAATAGAAIPILGTIGWALANGVRLQTLWYTIYGFRAEAVRAITSGSAEAPEQRAAMMLVISLATGIVLVIGGFLVHVRDEWRDRPAVTMATVAVILVDVTGLLLGGSFWRAYLFVLIPATALCAMLLVHRPSRRGRAVRAVIVIAAVSSAISAIGWTGQLVSGISPPTELYTGQAVGRAAEPGDSLTVFGGRADIQFASDLPSPYEHLWSLPMRTRDPDYAQLRAIVSGPDAPTWLIEWVSFTAWGNDDGGGRLRTVVSRRYDQHTRACGDHPVWLLKGTERPPLDLDCEKPYR